MTKWFVYCDATYYPFAKEVEAETAEAAGRAAAGHRYEDEWVAVFPADAMAHSNRGDDGEAL